MQFLVYPDGTKETICQNCYKTFKADWSGRKYCSRSCAAQKNNSLRPKRKAEIIYCLDCGTELLKSSRRKRCSDCISNRNDWTYLYTTTMGEYRTRFNRDAKAYNAARDISRKLYTTSDRPKMCAICRYDKFYEVCHIIGLAQIPDNWILWDALANGNLIALCRNHHWEFDHDML